MRSARMPARHGQILTRMPETASARGHAIDKPCGALPGNLPEDREQRRKEEKILEYIDENLFHSFLSLEYVAQHFGKSSAYISSLFKKSRGMHYVDYVNRCRVAKAEDILREERARICDVCTAVGYVSLTTFRRNFVKYTGKLPAEYSR